jgi:hypothetical protein
MLVCSVIGYWPSSRRRSRTTLTRSTSAPGPGHRRDPVLGLLYERQEVQRCPRGQDFVSYGRLVKCAQEAAGQRDGTAGTKIGHADLSWAFSEAAVLGWRANAAGQKSLTRVEKTHGKGKALTVLAHQLARAVSSMFKRAVTFD